MKISLLSFTECLFYCSLSMGVLAKDFMNEEEVAAPGTPPPKDVKVIIDEICGDPGDGFFMVSSSGGGGKDADKACQKYNGKLAEINDGNFIEATGVAFACSGPFSETLIHSWNGDDYKESCLLLITGTAAPGGSINRPANCNVPRKALCRGGIDQDRTDGGKDGGAGGKDIMIGDKDHYPLDDGGADSEKEEDCKHSYENSTDCECKRVKELWNFKGIELPAVGPNDEEFNYLRVGNYTSNDGKLSIVDGKLQVNSAPFTISSTVGGILDHLKFFIQSNQRFNFSLGQSISFEAKIKAKASGVDKQPFGAQVPDPSSDFRLAMASFNVIDAEQGLSYNFLITNKKIYVMYERLGSSRPILGNYAAYTFSLPVSDTKPNEEHHFKIILDESGRNVRWILDNLEVYKAYNVGTLLSRNFMVLDLGGRQQTTFSRELKVGFGTFSYLDGYSPCNIQSTTLSGAKVCVFPPNETALVNVGGMPESQLDPRNGITPAKYAKPSSDPKYRLWGQGVIMSISDMVVGLCEGSETL